MAIIKGVKEQVHLPLYDSVFVKAGEQFGDIQTSNILRFFQDVTGKTKLQTNMQASSVLPHWNTFEARAIRVVISDLPAQFPDKPVAETEFEVLDGNHMPVDPVILVKITNIRLQDYVYFSRRIEEQFGDPIFLNQDDLDAFGFLTDQTPDDSSLSVPGRVIKINRLALKDFEAKFEQQVKGSVPSKIQTFPHNGSGDLIGKFIYNTVSTLYVGEKIMMQMPTWFFPSGAGPYSEDGGVTTHGYPNPEATMRLANEVTVDSGQNVRFEIEVPENDALRSLQQLYGPLIITVVLDGYMTRDVQ